MQLSADASGTFILCGTSVATAQDWARFGQLVLDDGVWRGKRLLPEGWLAYACTPAHADDEPVYGGALMWLADGPLADNCGRIPAGGALAFGMLGQLTFVLPSHELVIVRMGHDWADEPILDAVAAIAAAVDPGRGD
jgi:CubicO group peptidase (beta-lactamase class C family)